MYDKENKLPIVSYPEKIAISILLSHTSTFMHNYIFYTFI